MGKDGRSGAGNREGERDSGGLLARRHTKKLEREDSWTEQPQYKRYHLKRLRALGAKKSLKRP